MPIVGMRRIVKSIICIVGKIACKLDKLESLEKSKAMTKILATTISNKDGGLGDIAKRYIVRMPTSG